MRNGCQFFLSIFMLVSASFADDPAFAVRQPEKTGGAKFVNPSSADIAIQPAVMTNWNKGLLPASTRTAALSKPGTSTGMTALQPDDIALSVNGDVIYWKDIQSIGETVARSSPAPAEEQAQRVEKVLRATIDKYVTARLLVQEANQRGITLSTEERTAYVENQKKEWVQRGLDPDKQLASFEKPSFAFAVSLEDTLKVVKLGATTIRPAVQVSDAEVDTQVEILKQTKAQNEVVNADARKSIADLHLKAVESGADFAALVREYSEGVDAGTGGELGPVGIVDLPDELAIPIQKMQVGEVSEVIETPISFHILKLLAREEGSNTNDLLFPSEDHREVTVAQIVLAKMEVRDIPDREEIRANLIARKEQEAIVQLAKELRTKAQIICPLFPGMFGSAVTNGVTNPEEKAAPAVEAAPSDSLKP